MNFSKINAFLVIRLNVLKYKDHKHICNIYSIENKNLKIIMNINLYAAPDFDIRDFILLVELKN